MTATNQTLYIVTNYWGSSKSYTKRVASFAAAVEHVVALRAQRRVRSVMVAQEPNTNGLILEYSSQIG